MQYVWFALAGLSAGGIIAMRQQKRPWWVLVVFALLAVAFVWFGLRESS
ncbi:hypothetical protein [Tenggerimyces flavus]|uniref:NADH dehydrogenase subunit 6 n=1 Tax=Tenggerimyces flavus TaxID=1708749 RepID=A0ABV7Y6X3_9ACTN|nr:hypothetical protein [Tenggerimyces flavus]MBM7788549.1 uncharacterized membrane protein YbhN (UPF0104 family) [Tenggerimyces flavus]